MSAFKAYVQIGENRFRENYGLSFEEFQVGQKFKHRPGVTVSQQDNKNEALDTINNAQLHYDAHYAQQTEWKKCLGDSTLTLQVVMGMTWKTFGKKQRILSYDEIVMTHPFFGGDTLYAESEIIDKEDSKDSKLGRLQVMTSGLNQHGDILCKIQYQVLVYKKWQYPLDRNLPADAFNLSSEKFSSHRQLSDGSYLEQVGIYFEQLELGEIYEHFPAKTLTLEESKRHALQSLDWSPQYVDLHYLSKYEDDRFIINENFLIGVVTALTTRTFGRVVANLQWKNIHFPLRVYADDTINAESKIISKRESKSRPAQGIIAVTTRAHNQNGELVCSYERQLLIYKKGLGPYQEAGY